MGASARTGGDGAARARRGSAAFALGAAAVLALAAAQGLRSLSLPGLYYDEAVQAVGAAEFVRGSARPADLPGGRSALVAGRWLPLSTLPYMGALKSQLLIPVFAAFGASTVSLRAATFGLGLAGLAFAMLFARRLCGAPVALVAGLLLAVDPAFLFVSRHDWGAFAPGFACRMAGLWLALAGFERRSAARLAGAGLLLGLGVYNKIDAAVPLAAAALAALVAAPGAVRASLARRPRELAALGAGLLLGAVAILPSAWQALRFAGRAAGGGTALAHELPEKLATWRTLLDGSHFLRLLRAGGRFEDLGSVEGAAATLFLPALAASALALGARLGLRRPWGREERAEAFLLAALALSVAGLLAVPGAVRVHHAMNAYPLPHLVVACALAAAWRVPVRGAARAALRGLAAAALAALLAGSLRADRETFAEIARGGRGRWSDALEAFARELEAEPVGPVVSFDWGFHAPLRLLAPGLDLREPIWSLRSAPAGAELAGTAESVYLVQDPRYRVFALGDELLAAVARLPQGVAHVRRHPDRSGETAFLSIRIDRPHHIVRGERLEIALE